MQTILRSRGYILLTLAYAILFGTYVLYDRRPQPEPLDIVQPTPALTPTPSLMRVHVVGAVQQPGLYELGVDGRLMDAVRAAGGLTAQADAESINLADRVRDGQQVYVPRLHTPVPPSPTPMTAPGVGSGAGEVQWTARPGGALNINTATAAELEGLPGIGPIYAQRIVAYRQANGPFTQPSQIQDVRGIGPSCYDQIKAMIVVE